MKESRSKDKLYANIDEDRELIRDILYNHKLETIITSYEYLKKIQMLLQVNGLDVKEREMLRNMLMNIINEKGSLYLPSLDNKILQNISKILVLLIICDFPSQWSEVFNHFKDILSITSEASHLILCTLDYLYGLIKDGLLNNRGSRMEERFNTIYICITTSRDVTVSLLDIFVSIINIHIWEEDCMRDILITFSKYIEWIGPLSIVNHSLGNLLLSLIEPNSYPPSTAVYTWNTINLLFQIPMDLVSKLNLLKSYPILSVISSADTTTMSIGVSVCTVSSNIGKDIILCWRVYGQEEEKQSDMYKISLNLLQTSMNLNFKLLSSYSHRQGRHVIMSYIKTLVEEIGRVYASNDNVSMTNIFNPAIGSLLSSLSSCMQLPLDFKYERLYPKLNSNEGKDTNRQGIQSDEAGDSFSPNVYQTNYEGGGGGGENIDQAIQDLRTEASYIYKELFRACPSVITSSSTAGVSRCLVDPSVPFPAFENVLFQLYLLSPETMTDISMLDRNIISIISLIHTSLSGHPQFTSLHYSILLAYYQMTERYLVLFRYDMNALVCFLNILGSEQGLKSMNLSVRKYAIILFQSISENLQDVLVPYINGLLNGISPLLHIPPKNEIEGNDYIMKEERNILYTTAGILIGSSYISVEERVLLLHTIGDYIVNGLNEVIKERENEGVVVWITDAIGGLIALATGYSKSIEDNILPTPSSLSYTNIQSMIPHSTSKGNIHGGKMKKVTKSLSDTKLYGSSRMMNSMSNRKGEIEMHQARHMLNNLSLGRKNKHLFASEYDSSVTTGGYKDIRYLWGGSAWFSQSANIIVNLYMIGYELPSLTSLTIQYLMICLDCCSEDIVPIISTSLPFILNHYESTSNLMEIISLTRKCIIVSSKDGKNLISIIQRIFVSLMDKIYTIIKSPIESESTNEDTSSKERRDIQRLFYKLIYTISRSEYVSEILLCSENINGVGPLLESLVLGCASLYDLQGSKIAFACLYTLLEVWLIQKRREETDHDIEGFKHKHNNRVDIEGERHTPSLFYVEGFIDNLKTFYINQVTPAVFRLSLRPDIDEIADVGLINNISKFFIDMKGILGEDYVEYLRIHIFPIILPTLPSDDVYIFLHHLKEEDSINFSEYFETFVHINKIKIYTDDEEDG